MRVISTARVSFCFEVPTRRRMVLKLKPRFIGFISLNPTLFRSGVANEVSADRARPEYFTTNGYCPQVIFIDSMSSDMSSLDRSGMRCPEAKAISVPLKSLSLYASTFALDPTMIL